MCQSYSKPKVKRFLRHGVDPTLRLILSMHLYRPHCVANCCDKTKRVGETWRWEQLAASLRNLRRLRLSRQVTLTIECSLTSCCCCCCVRPSRGKEERVRTRRSFWRLLLTRLLGTKSSNVRPQLLQRIYVECAATELDVVVVRLSRTIVDFYSWQLTSWGRRTKLLARKAVVPC